MMSRFLRLPQPRLTVGRMLIAIAAVSLLLILPTEWARTRQFVRLQHADWYARTGAEYRRNARGDAGMLRIADWHDHMRGEFESAARRPWSMAPATSPFPPPEWRPPAD